MWPADKNAPHNLTLGQTGEQQAIAFLVQKGYFIRETNWRYKNDEIDIIAFDQEHQEVVFVEVKTRAGEVLGDPSEAVDYRKLKAQARIANFYIKTHKINFDYRFDIIAINNGQLEHFENISWLFS